MLLFSAHSYTQYKKFVQIKELFSNPFCDIYLYFRILGRHTFCGRLQYDDTETNSKSFNHFLLCKSFCFHYSSNLRS